MHCVLQRLRKKLFTGNLHMLDYDQDKCVSIKNLAPCVHVCTFRWLMVRWCEFSPAPFLLCTAITMETIQNKAGDRDRERERHVAPHENRDVHKVASTQYAGKHCREK